MDNKILQKPSIIFDRVTTIFMNMRGEKTLKEKFLFAKVSVYGISNLKMYTSRNWYYERLKGTVCIKKRVILRIQRQINNSFEIHQ